MNSFSLHDTNTLPVRPNVEIATFGLPTSINPVFAWAEKLGLSQIFLATLDATKTDHHPEYFGTVVQFLRHQETLVFLASWAEEMASARELHRLSEACSVSPFVTNAYPGMPSLKLVSQQLTGGLLTNLCAVALVARPIPSLADADQHWIGAMRSWFFLQIVDSVFRGGRPNAYLLDTTNKLRLAIDRDEQWIKLFIRLRGSSASFHGMTRHLGSTCQQLLVNKISPVESSTHRLLLSTLRNFCNGKVPQAQNDDGADDHGLFLKFLNRKSPNSSASFLPPEASNWPRHFDDATSDQASDERGSHWNFDPSMSEESVLGVTPVDPTLTIPDQEYQSNGIQLATCEDHQYLPYSWNRPSPTELSHLKDWLASTLQGADCNLQVLAAFVEISIQSANSLDTVLALGLSDVSGADWACDTKTGHLHRLPPRRYNGWQVTSESAPWVEPLAASSRIAISSAATRTLQRLHNGVTSSTQLGHLWPASIGETPATIFNRLCLRTNGMERLRSGMLSLILEQHVFERTTDPVLAELLASHPRTGLGGACAYASYRQGQVGQVLSPITPASATPPVDPVDPVDPRTVAAGSQLSPLDTALRQACDEALVKINQLSTQPEQWVMHHNTLTTYVVVVLLAATGGRPVTSPFESLDHFDWEMLSLYIEDKVSSRLHQGRLLPIPAWVATLIKECYLPHLARLSILVSQIDSQLSVELARLSQGTSSDRLPTFFLLGTEPRLRWFEVSETSMSALELFSWPLPWNLMRHRLSTRLKRAAQDHESINGLTGHSDQGTAPYGPYSMRIWNEDAQHLRQPLSETLALLQLQMPVLAQWPVTALTGVNSILSPTQTSCLKADARFGSLARQNRRELSHQQAVEQAQEEILTFIRARPIDSLSPQEWEALSQQMLLNDDGRPRTLGTIRYEALQKWLARNWKDSGIRPRIKRRYLPSLEEQSPFTANVTGCQKRIACALEIAHRIGNSTEPSRTSLRKALALGIMLLILESRIAEPSMLKSLVLGKDFRLVLFQQRYYIEHSPGLDRVPSAPVRRYQVSATAAKLLARAKTSLHTLDVTNWPTSHKCDEDPSKVGIRDIWKPIGVNSSQFESFYACVLDMLAHVRQANVLQYPGLVAAYLNGDIVSAGLGHADWVRVALGRAANMGSIPIANNDIERNESNEEENSEDEEEQDTPSEDIDATYVAWPDAFMAVHIEVPSEVSELQQCSFEFFKQMRIALDGNKGEDSKSKDKHKPTKIPSRRDLDSKLRALISDHRGRVSRTCLLLGEWQRSLLWRKTKKGLIRINSLKRYLNSLSVCFQAMAYNHDLLDCDEEEVTDFYRRVMEMRHVIRPDRVTDTESTKRNGVNKAKVDQEDDAARHYRSLSLALQLLRDFHRLVSREFGVEDPDWSEISITDELLSISPGLITEAEYSFALRMLAPTPTQASREQLARAFILISAYRFGLRGDEAAGLFRADWVDAQPESLVVLVRGNRLRRLKTPAAQRQVPLLFELTDHEKEIVSSWMASWEGITTLNGEGPLLAQQAAPDMLMNGKLLRYQVNQVIKQTTCNPGLSLHHARHTFANRVAMLLMSGTEELWPHAASPTEISEQRKNHVKRLLLCTNQVTRRSLWALARLLGHAHPQTTVRSYLHLLPELAEKYLNLPTHTKRPVSTDLRSIVLNLDQFSFHDNYLQSKEVRFEEPPSFELTADRAIRFLHLCQRGTSILRAKKVIGLTDEDAERLIHGVQQVDSILARRPAINSPSDGPFNLLGHIPQSRWAELIRLAQRVIWLRNADELFDLGINDVPLIIGSSRQVVMWKPEHFKFFKMVLDGWKLNERCYRIHSTARGKDNLTAMAREANLSFETAKVGKTNTDTNEKIKTVKGQRKKLILITNFQQIDPIEIDVRGQLLSVKDRCAVLTQTDPQSALRSSHELVLIVLISLALQGERTYQKGAVLNGSSGM